MGCFLLHNSQTFRESFYISPQHARRSQYRSMWKRVIILTSVFVFFWRVSVHSFALQIFLSSINLTFCKMNTAACHSIPRKITSQAYMCSCHDQTGIVCRLLVCTLSSYWCDVKSSFSPIFRFTTWSIAILFSLFTTFFPYGKQQIEFTNDWQAFR